MERTDRAPARPLVVRFGAMGDMVIALALIEALHRRYGTPVDVVSSGGGGHVPCSSASSAWARSC
jgi:hypothetical protein